MSNYLRPIARLVQCQKFSHAFSSESASKNYQHPCTEVNEFDGVREIVLNEPKTRNSLSMDMMNAIHADLTKDIDNEELRCIILSSRGPVWSAGHNLKELANHRKGAYHVEVFNRLTDIIMSIQKAPVPVIAKVDGLAAAAGCQLVASCDMVVATDKSSFSTPGANFGIFCSTPGIAISRVMPRLKSAYMVMTGLSINAQEAYIAGLVSKVVPEKQLETEITHITNAIKSKSRAVISLGKEFYYKQLGLDIEEAYAAGSRKMAENLCLPDGKEGLDSFVEKRKPNWRHT